MPKLDGQITRRTMLRGAGAMLALPFLEAMLPVRVRAAEARPPLRLGIVSVTGGTIHESWQPKAAGPLPERLPSILRSLEFARDDLLLLSGLTNHGQLEGDVNGHTGNAWRHLTGAPHVKSFGGRTVAGVSVDQAVAQAVGAQTYLPSMEIGLNGNEYSFRTPESPLRSEANPRVLFDRMFRGRKPTVPDWSRRSAAIAEFLKKTARPDSQEQSVVDLVLDEANGMCGKVGAGDKRKLDEYLDSVRSIEKRIAFAEFRREQEALEAASGRARTHELYVPEIRPEAKAYDRYLHHEVWHDPEKHGEYLRMIADLMVLAFQTDTMRVVTFSMGSDDALFPGVITVGQEYHGHTLEHQGNTGQNGYDPIAREACRQIHEWYTQIFAAMVARLKKIDEGGSSLLDNSLLLYTSYMANGWHSSINIPALLVGKAAGSLKTGRHLAYKEGTPMSNLYVEILNRFGVRVDQFGESGTAAVAAHGGRLPELG